MQGYKYVGYNGYDCATLVNAHTQTYTQPDSFSPVILLAQPAELS